MATKLAAAVAILLLSVTSAADAKKGRPRSCTVYTYIDDAGESVRTRKYESIPGSKRQSVLIYEDCDARLGAGGEAHSYVKEGGEDEPDAEVWNPGSAGARRETSAASEPDDWKEWFRQKHAGIQGWRGFFTLILGAFFLAGFIGLVVDGFRANALWGVGNFLIPLVPVFFVIYHARESGFAFFCWLAGLAGGIVVVYAV